MLTTGGFNVIPLLTPLLIHLAASQLTFSPQGHHLEVTCTTLPCPHDLQELNKPNLTTITAKYPNVTSLGVHTGAIEVGGDPATLRHLYDLDLSGNRLQRIPDLAMQIPGLKTLNMSGNILAKLDRSQLEPFFSRLISLDLSDNPLECSRSLSWLELASVRDVVNISRVTCEGRFKDPLHLNDKKPLHKVLSRFRLVDRTCPERCRCQLQSVEPVQVSVNCSRSGLTPDQRFKLPEGTISLDISNNQLRSVEFLCPLLQANENLTWLNLSSNQLNQLGHVIRCLSHVVLLDLRGNQLSRLPIMALRGVRTSPYLYLSGNPWNCQLERTELLEFQDFLLTNHRSIPDLQEVRCSSVRNSETSGVQVYRLHLQSPALDERPGPDALDLLIVAETLLLCFLLVVFARDIRSYYSTGKLPWLAANMPTCKRT